MLQSDDAPAAKNTAEAIVQKEERELKSHDLVYQFPGCLPEAQEVAQKTAARRTAGQSH